jgi:hypothetical protein
MTPVSRKVLLTLCAVALAVSGCATKYELKPPASSNALLVIGNMDMSEVGSTLASWDVERLTPNPEKIDSNFKTHWDKRSYTFFSEQLPPGQYQLQSVMGYVGNISIWYDFKDDPRFKWTLQKSRINYIGSYKLIRRKSGNFGYAFEAVQVKEPGEREALLRVLKWEMDPFWKSMVEKRLKELPK